MKPFLLLSLFSIAALQATSPTPEARPGKDHAVFFAVEKYRHAQLTNLQNPVRNAREIAGELHRRFGFDTLVMVNPSQQQIIAKLEELTRLYATNADGRHPADGQLFLFFSGHGMSEDENGYFLPADADPAQPWAKGIAYEIWRPKIDKINCRHILVAIDACYSVRFDPDWKNKPDGLFKRPGELTDAQKARANYEQYVARVFFTSDNKEDQTPDRSNFARKLLEGLRTAPTPDGFLTSGRLFANYVQDATPTPRAGAFGSDQPSSAFLLYDQTPAPSAPADPDAATWTSVQRQNTPDAYAYYIEAYPNGRYRAEALDERAWGLALRQKTAAAYSVYLDTYPDGRHRAEAQAKAAPPVAPPEARPDNMILIKGGTFQMGSDDGESNEKPVHTVILRDFYLGKYEVTVAEFKAFVEATGYQTDAEKEGASRAYEDGKWVDKPGRNWRHDPEGKPAQDNHPVINVSWNDATEYCKWLSQKTSKTYRLPTEAEWEYAAGNGNRHTKYSWGNGDPAGKKGGNVADETGAAKFNWTKNAANIFLGYTDGFATTAPVGSFYANDFGLHDMSGNVWEWCGDWYGTYLSDAQTNPTGPASGSLRVCRGGSWCYNPRSCRAADRLYDAPGFRSYEFGFRLARTL